MWTFLRSWLSNLWPTLVNHVQECRWHYVDKWDYCSKMNFIQPSSNWSLGFQTQMKAAVLEEKYNCRNGWLLKSLWNISKKVLQNFIKGVSSLPQVHSGLSFVLATSWQGSLKTLCPEAASDSPWAHRTAPRSAPWTPCWPRSHPAAAWGLEEKQGWVRGCRGAQHSAATGLGALLPPSSPGLPALLPL